MSFQSIYMFAGIAIVCDDYFVPALEKIVVKLDLTMLLVPLLWRLVQVRLNSLLLSLVNYSSFFDFELTYFK